jgi:hypothetical protein
MMTAAFQGWAAIQTAAAVSQPALHVFMCVSLQYFFACLAEWGVKHCTFGFIRGQ